MKGKPMRARAALNHQWIGWTGKFNTHSLSECIVYYNGGDCSSEYFKDIEVQLANGQWVNLAEALKQKLVIPDNYNVQFRQPINELEQERGWFD